MSNELDFSIFDTETAGTAGATLHLRHPATGEKLYADGDKKQQPVTITMESIDGDTFTKAQEKKLKELQRKQKARKRNGQQDDDEEIDIEGSKLSTAQLYAKMTKGWTHIKLPGEKKDAEFTFENAVKVYLNFKEIRNQFSAFAADKANFIKG